MSLTLQTDTYDFSSSTGWTLVPGATGTTAIGAGVLTMTIPGATVLPWDGVNGYLAPYVRRANFGSPAPSTPIELVLRVVSLTGGGSSPANEGLGVESSASTSRYSVHYALDIDKVVVALHDTNTTLALSSAGVLPLDGTGWYRIYLDSGSISFGYGTGTTTTPPTSWSVLHTAVVSTTAIVRPFIFQRQVISGAPGTVTSVHDDLRISYYVEVDDPAEDADLDDAYQNYAVALAPPWLQEDRGDAFLRGWARCMDRGLEQIKQAVKRRFPDQIGADGDAVALSHLGTERGLERLYGEADVDYAERLRLAWQTYRKAGTGAAIVDALTLLGYSTISFILNRDWSPSPPDGDTTWDSRFWVVIEGHPFGAETYGGGSTYGSGFTYGFDADYTQELNAIIRAVKKWKPAHSYCSHIVIAYGADILPAGKTVTGFSVGNNAAYVPVGA